MRVHLIGVSGTGMGSLAMLLREAGHEVSGSDISFDPPIGPALLAAGIACVRGYDAAHIDASFDRVVVGNAIRKDNPEALQAESLGVARTSMSAALREHFLKGRKPLVVGGTHGKTTTSSMCAWLLSSAGYDPGFFIGGIPKNFPSGASIGRAKPNLLKSAGRPSGPSPFVVEGDEYDAVYWHKAPKFLDYIGIGEDDVAMVTSVEQDHIDIYPTVEAYEAAFAAFVRKVPPGGIVVCDAKNARAREIVKRESRARAVFYALEGDDTGDVTPTWHGAPCAVDERGMQLFDMFAGGVSCGRFAMRMPGAHNVRNAVGAMAACAEGFGAPIDSFRAALMSFEGVRRRQDLLGEPGGVRVYDDFAHHPTAVDETLRALRGKHPKGALWAVFEPRSATACRNLHQEEYARAFSAADRVIFAPLGRSNIPEHERLDTAALAGRLGTKAAAAPTVDAILESILLDARSGDTVALLSNGAFSGLYGKLLAALAVRP